MPLSTGAGKHPQVQGATAVQESKARWFFQQLIIAVNYAQRMNVVSRDKKLEYTLLDGSPHKLIRIFDTGYSKNTAWDSVTKSCVGTPNYTGARANPCWPPCCLASAPELLRSPDMSGQGQCGSAAMLAWPLHPRHELRTRGCPILRKIDDASCTDTVAASMVGKWIDGCCQCPEVLLWLPAAPEIILGHADEYDGKAVDVWTCGVMLFVMLFSQYPFERPQDEQQLSPTKRYQRVSPCTSLIYRVQGAQYQPSKSACSRLAYIMIPE